MHVFVDRQQEMETLQSEYERNGSALVVLYGRRRVGKTTLGEDCLIDCSSIPVAYCDFATQKVTRISFEELQVNDKVIVSIRSSEMESFRSGGGGENTIKVEQLQLYTQRVLR